MLGNIHTTFIAVQLQDCSLATLFISISAYYPSSEKASVTMKASIGCYFSNRHIIQCRKDTYLEFHTICLRYFIHLPFILSTSPLIKNIPCFSRRITYVQQIIQTVFVTVLNHLSSLWAKRFYRFSFSGAVTTCRQT